MLRGGFEDGAVLHLEAPALTSFANDVVVKYWLHVNR